MSVKGANQGEQMQPDINTEINFNSSDIVKQDSGELFVNVDGVKRPKQEDEEPVEEPSSLENIQATPEPRTRFIEKIPIKLIVRIVMIIAIIGALVGAGIFIYRFINRDKIESAEVFQSGIDYGERLNEISEQYENDFDYDSAMIKLKELVDNAKGDKEKIIAQNNALIFIAKYASDFKEAEEYRAGYCQDDSYPGDNLCGAPDRILYIYRERRGLEEENAQ
jgi:hypothetical protein